MIFGGSGGEIYTVVDEESESEVENLEILHPDLAIKENSEKRWKSLFLFISPISFFGGSLITGGSGVFLKSTSGNLTENCTENRITAISCY